ncbi:MAG: PAS domain-containing protein [Leptolyngbyaceae cyanobacterium]
MKRYFAHLFQLTVNRSAAVVSVGVALTLLLCLPLGWSAWHAYLLLQSTAQTQTPNNLPNLWPLLVLASIISIVSLLTLLPIWWVILQALQRHIKAQMNSQNALQTVESQLETVLNTVPANISWVDSNGVFMGVNHCLANSLGLSPGAIVGKTANALDGNTQLAQFLEEFLLSPKELEDRRIEIEIKGETRCYLVGVQKYHQGQAAVSFGLDITECQQAEDALKLAEEKYRSIFENALEGIFQSSPDGRFISVNPAMAKIHCYDSPEEMIDTVSNIAQQIYVDKDRHGEFIQAISQEGTVKSFEYRSYRKDGSIIWTQVDARVVRDKNDQVLYYEGIVQDISDRVLREELLRRQLEELKIEIDQEQRREEVVSLTSSNYFQEVKKEVSAINLEDFWT